MLYGKMLVILQPRKQTMRCFEDIYEAIANDGFAESTLQAINELVKDIENGSTDLPRFNLREHSGICQAGSALIGASCIASYAERSLRAGGHAGSSQTGPSNWEIDELQEKLIDNGQEPPAYGWKTLTMSCAMDLAL